MKVHLKAEMLPEAKRSNRELNIKKKMRNPKGLRIFVFIVT